MKILHFLYPHRFEIFLISLILILFGTLIIPNHWYASYLNPIFFLVNILAGILLISKKKTSRYVYLGILFTTMIIFILSTINVDEGGVYSYLEFAVLFAFYCLVTIDVIHQVWNTSSISSSVITGLMSGYICLGLIGFFMCMAVELNSPDSFAGLDANGEVIGNKREALAYFSFITLLTIGYGDILPLTKAARNVSVVLGLLGQFYLVIVTAVVIEKYIRNNVQKK